ncbi:hypothetical protein [Poritiphilus flavus]|uniref:MG2 domain-containing protein n=1 Tax=Poritiphilus flavus TaxID=2697053 RepID=A0A6L9EI02_9FLAO|nr:hypothetical protein [Poritiphilus flavus]NAS14361.1 hypothetical protein [Poritiphilus flavus]
MRVPVASFLFFLLLNSTSLCGQLSTLEEAHAEFFTPHRELFHLQTNKAAYIEGEHIWFAAYVLNQLTEKPSDSTRNLYVGIYDEQGIEIKKKLLHVNQGVTHGNFLIDSLFIKDKYYLKAYSNWMKNFAVSNSFTKSIRILGRKSAANEHDNSLGFDLQILPEGGHLVEGTHNTVGFKLMQHQGTGVQVAHAELMDNNGKAVVSDILNNHLGFGKFRFYYEDGRNYSLRAHLGNGEVVEKSLPLARDKGLSLSLKVMNPVYLLMRISTNRATLDERTGQKCYLAFHKNKELIIKEFVLEHSNHFIRLRKSELPKGLNQLTLFDESLNPISRRLFFNDIDLKRLDLDVSAQNYDRDSVNLFISPKAAEKTKASYRLSASVLPEATRVQASDNSILSSFWLKPYLRHPVENPAYYFENLRAKMLALDHLLIVQGWSNYDWDRIFNYRPEYKFDFEKEITISGKIINADLTREQNVMLRTSGSENFIIAPLDRNKNLLLKAPLFKNESLDIAIINDKGKLRRPRLDLTFLPRADKDFLSLSELRLMDNEMDMFPEDEVEFANGGVAAGNLIRLKEVEVFAQNSQKEKEYLFQLATDEGTIITDEDRLKYRSVYNYLRSLGFEVEIFNNQVRIRANQGHLRGFIPIYIDGLPVHGRELVSMPLVRVQAVVFDTFKEQYVNVILRNGDYTDPNLPAQYISTIIKQGYAKPSQYYEPLYTSLSPETLENYGSIAWLPDLVSGQDGTTSFSFLKSGQNSVKVFVEGFDEQGRLVSVMKTVEIQ